MKYLPVAVVVAVVLLSAAASAEDKYTNKYDNTNIDELLGNERLLNQYCNCLLDKGKCTPDGTELKGHISEALKTGCAKCTEKQKAGLEKVLKHLSEHKMDVFKELLEKYDTDGTYRKQYSKLAKEHGIQL